MSGVVFACLEAVFTEVKVITVSTFESGPVNGKHLAAITPGENTGVACKGTVVLLVHLVHCELLSFETTKQMASLEI